MQSLLQNKFVRFGLFGIGTLFGLFVLLLIVMNMLTTSTGLSGTDIGYTPTGTPTFNNSLGRDSMMMQDSEGMMEAESSYYYPPVPAPDGYTSGLESYETSSYLVTAHTKEFDALCDTLTTLKRDAQIHFRTLTSSTNNCYATFFVAEEKVESVLATLTAYRGVEVTRDTESVTRHKQRLESQTAILEQQLARVESSLTAAQTQLDRLNQVFNSSDDVTRLSSEVTKSLQYIDQLTQRKINLISQLDNIYQQSADLAERMEVVQFDVNIIRAIPLITNKYERQWDQAWEDLKDEFTNTLIGITAFFGVFLLWILRFGLYLLVLIVVLRGLWKFGKVVWKKW